MTHKRAMLFAALIALLVGFGITGCSGGGAPTWPGQPKYEGSQGIEEIEGWEQVTFWIGEKGGSFAFPGGRMFIPAGAAPARRQYSIAKAPGDNFDYIAQPGEYEFVKPVRIRFNNAEIDPSRPEDLWVYHFRAAEPGDLAEVGEYIMEEISNLIIFPGGFEFEADHFSVLGYISHPEKYNRIVYAFPLKYYPKGAIPLRAGNWVWFDPVGGYLLEPGHVGIVADDLSIIHSSPAFFSIGGLRRETTLDEFLYPGNKPTTYFGTYFPREDPDGSKFALLASQYALSNWDDKLHYSYFAWPGKESLVCTSFVNYCYNSNSRTKRFVDIPLLPKHIIDQGFELVNEMSVSVPADAFDIEVTYVYYDFSIPSLTPPYFLYPDQIWSWKNPKPTNISDLPAGLFNPSVENNKLVIGVDPELAKSNSYTIEFEGWDNRGDHHRTSKFTINFTSPPEPPEPGPGQIDPTFFPSIVTFVAVIGKDSRDPILGLTEDNFIVKEYPHTDGFDTGVPALITNVRYLKEDEPGSEISVVLCLDRSGSMSGTPNDDLVEAANAFVDLMRPEDVAEVINFDDVVRVDQPFTSDGNLLKVAIDNYYGGGTALFDAIYKSIEDASPQTGRKAVIAMTDGLDTSSSRNLIDIYDLEKDALVPVNTVGLGSVDTTLLQQIANGTGGVFYHTPSSEDLTSIYEYISGSLAGQIRIEYFSPFPYDTTPDTEREVWVYLTNYPPFTDSGDILLFNTAYRK